VAGVSFAIRRARRRPPQEQDRRADGADGRSKFDPTEAVDGALRSEIGRARCGSAGARLRRAFLFSGAGNAIAGAVARFRFSR